MNIIEARELLGLSEYAELDEINAAHDEKIDEALKTGNLELFKRSTRAVAELLFESKRFSRSQADQYVKSQDEFIVSAGADLDQRLTDVREIDKKIRQEELLLIEDIDNKHRAEARRDQIGEELAKAEAEVESARAALIASENARIARRDARWLKLKQMFSIKSRK
jgi:hypothetical protein